MNRNLPARTDNPQALLEAAEPYLTEEQDAAVHALTVSLFDRARRHNAKPKLGGCELLPAYDGASEAGGALWDAATLDASLRVVYGVSLSYFNSANQCDGCKRGLALDSDGFHIDPASALGATGCDADLYN